MRAILYVAALFCLASCGAEREIDWAKTALPPVTKSDYLWLRDCVSAKSSADVAGAVSCFRDVRNLSENSISAETSVGTVPVPISFPGLRALRNPPIIIVPDCLEFVLQIPHAETAPFFRSAASIAHSPPPNAWFYYYSNTNTASLNSTSVFGIEANHPQRRIPGGEYSALFHALIRTGYIDGVTLRAGLWSNDDPSSRIKATIVDVMKSNTGAKPILVARGAGCTIAASVASSVSEEDDIGTKVRAVFCLADPPDPAVSPGTFASELGLLERRRGRLLPVVAGPWGDGNGARRCALPGTVISPTIAFSSSLCSGDCIRGGWMNDAKLVDCFHARSMRDEIECLSSALVKMEEKLVQPESPLGE